MPQSVVEIEEKIEDWFDADRENPSSANSRSVKE